ncbi:zinc finger protein 501-like [Penaeus monodon]|uniref:zinc finger protein 501-like n=1 Tax=Penaeus monodon TaxID=6687 RepID=UPI0018A7A988|nr:zinc finger protein 501-like [Penaeus monodon]
MESLGVKDRSGINKRKMVREAPIKLVPNICDKCGAIFATAFEVESHLLVHIESAMSDNIIETVYSLNLIKFYTIVGKLYVFGRYATRNFAEVGILQSTLVKHIRIHNGEKSYGCKECGKTFSQNVTLVHHIQRHTVEKPFTCSLNAHMGEKPHT